MKLLAFEEPFLSGVSVILAFKSFYIVSIADHRTTICAGIHFSRELPGRLSLMTAQACSSNFPSPEVNGTVWSCIQKVVMVDVLHIRRNCHTNF